MRMSKQSSRCYSPLALAGAFGAHATGRHDGIANYIAPHVAVFHHLPS
jgi:hypothetical protein